MSASPSQPLGGGGLSAPPGGGAFRLLKRLVAGVDKLTYMGIVATMGLMTVIVSLQVLMRYAFSSSIDSADELSRLCFVWAIFLAIPHGVKHGVHVGIDLFVHMMPKPLQNALYNFPCYIFDRLLLPVRIDV